MERFLWSLLWCSGIVLLVSAAPSVRIRDATEFRTWDDGHLDCNCPLHWVDGKVYVFTSVGTPYRLEGTDVVTFNRSSEVHCTIDDDKTMNGGRWIESTHFDHDSGVLFGWYHNEPGGICGHLTAPRIGAILSHDNGVHWHDLGFVLEARKGSLDCNTTNRYNAGGNGDFTVLIDRQREWFYFFFSAYAGNASEQGIAIARMRYADRLQPSGKVFKWYDAGYTEPGLGGRLTPIIPVKVDWRVPNADAMWGPSLSWNTHLRSYVMLMNHANSSQFDTEGYYVSYATDLADDPVGSFTEPTKVMDVYGNGVKRETYPEVVGLGAEQTDKEAGQLARFVVHGISYWEAVFEDI